MPNHRASLQRYDWPGIVGELQNMIQGTVITSSGGSLPFDHFLREATAQ